MKAIPIEDGYPPNDKEVLIYTLNPKIVFTGSFRTDGNWLVYDNEGLSVLSSRINFITHWRPIPKIDDDLTIGSSGEDENDLWLSAFADVNKGMTTLELKRKYKLIKR